MPMTAPVCPRCGAPPWDKTAAYEAPDDSCCWAAGQRSEAAYESCARRTSAQLAALRDERERIAKACEEFKRARKAFLAGVLVGRVAIDGDLNELTGALVDAQRAALDKLVAATGRKGR